MNRVSLTNTFLAKARPHWSQACSEKFLVTLTSVDVDPVLPLSPSCRRVLGVATEDEVVDEEEKELRWCMCFSLRRVSGGLGARRWRLWCRSCLRVTGGVGDAATEVAGVDEASWCLRVAAGGCVVAEDEEEEEEVGAGPEEQSCCLRVTGGEGEDEEEDEEEAWRPFTSSLPLALRLLPLLPLLSTTSASRFTARLSSLGMIFARYDDDFLCTTVTWRSTSRLRRDS